MEKKVTKKFYLLSLVNLIPVVVMGWGNMMDMLVLAGILVALVSNHTILVKIIGTLSESMQESASPKSPVFRILSLMFIKMMLLVGILVLAYLYSSALVPKVMLLMIFQLIIQVVSIKNNY